MSRQRRVGTASREETTRRLLAAAGAEFAEHGFQRARVSRIAERAGCTVQTLYLACGSKRALLRAHLIAAISEGTLPPEAVVQRFVGLDPVATIDTLAAVFVQIAGRSASAWRLYLDAAAVDEQIAADWDELQRYRHATISRIVAGIPDTALRAGLSREAAADTAWTVASPASHALLVGLLRYAPDRYGAWIASTLRAALLA